MVWNMEIKISRIQIPISNKTKQNKEDFDTIMDNLHKKRDTDIINSLNVEKEKNMLLMYDFVEYNTTKTWPNKSNIDCLWCCFSFENEPYGLPITLIKITALGLQLLDCILKITVW